MIECAALGILPRFEIVSLVADIASVQQYSLVLGIGTLAGGILLLIHHKRHLNEALSGDIDERTRAFEYRKYRRRALASTLIASLGIMLAALFWVSDQAVFATLILLILTLLTGITGLALIDLVTVGIQHLGTPDKATHKEMIEEFLRKREDAKRETPDE